MDFTSIPFGNLKAPLKGIIFGGALWCVSSPALTRSSSTHTHTRVSPGNADEQFHLSRPAPGVAPPRHRRCPPPRPAAAPRHRHLPRRLSAHQARTSRPANGGGRGGSSRGLRTPSSRPGGFPARPAERGERPGRGERRPFRGVRGVTRSDPRMGRGGGQGEQPGAQRGRRPPSEAPPLPHARGERNGQEYSGPREGRKEKVMNNLNKSATEPRRGGGRRRVM